MASNMISHTVCPGHAESNVDSELRNDEETMLCQHCVRRSLQQARNRYLVANERYESACEYYEQNSPIQSSSNNNNNNNIETNILLELPLKLQQAQKLRQRLEQLRNYSSTLVIKVASKSVQLEQRSQTVQLSVSESRQVLQRWRACQLQALSESYNEATIQVKAIRYNWACLAFDTHQLDVSSKDFFGETSPTSNVASRLQRRQGRGVGKIGGLPLPHAGPELYSVLPTRELESALRLVASLTKLLSRCLGIRLPHPIVSGPSSANATSTIDTNGHQAILRNNKDADLQSDLAAIARKDNDTSDCMHETEQLLADLTGELLSSQNQQTTSNTKKTDSTANWTSWILDKAAKGISTATSTIINNDVTTTTTRHATESVQERIRNNTFAILAEEAASTTRYVLTTAEPDAWNTALLFLQNNIVALCVRAGVPVQDLWPAEAVLLNLYALKLHCESNQA